MNSEKRVFSIIGLLSAAVIGFLVWLIYFKTGAEVNSQGWVSYLPAVNAFFNALTAIFLISGYVSIKWNDVELHKKLMLAATTTSALFLVSYITYHHYQGDTKFQGIGIIRPIYFFILITHILLSVVQVPLILSTLYLAFVKNYKKHRKFALVTFPIWLYVSVTGVLIFIILKIFNQGA
jgi:putative membrane protein